LLANHYFLSFGFESWFFRVSGPTANLVVVVAVAVVAFNVTNDSHKGGYYFIIKRPFDENFSG
jgi:hypothetical protein